MPGTWPGSPEKKNWSYINQSDFIGPDAFDPNDGAYSPSYENGKRSAWQCFGVNALCKVPTGGSNGDVNRMFEKLMQFSKECRIGKTLNAVGHSGGGIVAINAALMSNAAGNHVDNVYTIASPIFSLGKWKLRRQGTNVRSFYGTKDPVSWIAAVVDFFTGDWKNLFNKENWIKSKRWFTRDHVDLPELAAPDIKDDISAQEYAP